MSPRRAPRRAEGDNAAPTRAELEQLARLLRGLPNAEILIAVRDRLSPDVAMHRRRLDRRRESASPAAPSCRRHHATPQRGSHSGTPDTTWSWPAPPGPISGPD